MRYVFLLLATLAFYFPAFSQSSSGIVKGVVTDSLKASPLSFVTVSA